MGKRSRQRRRAEQRLDGSGARPGGGGARQRIGERPQDGGGGAPHSPDALVDMAVAAWAVAPELYGRMEPVLLARVEEVAPAAERRLHAALDIAWRGGWGPADAAHVVGRELTARHVDLLAGLAVEDGRRRTARGQPLPARWSAELAALSERSGPDAVQAHAEGIATATALLVLLGRLGTVPSTMPRPGAAPVPAGGRLDVRVLGRVRALLAKAESTEFEHEAEALTAKAQELIARHAIDEALLSTVEDVGAPALRRILVDDPYADAKARLVSEVAAANGCRAVHSPAHGWVTAFGYDSALDALELLAASLLTQATGAMARHGPQRDPAGRSRTRAFRRSFLYGFATRVGQRLRVTTAEHVTAAGAEHGGLLPVLAAREERIEEAVAAAFPRLVSRRVDLSHAGGWEAGRVAADLADLDVGSGALRRSTDDHPGG